MREDSKMEEISYLSQSRQFLMREFLTWLVARARQSNLVTVNGATYMFCVDDQVTLVGRGQETRYKGGTPGHCPRMWSEIRAGKVVSSAKFVLQRGSEEWAFTMDESSLMPKSMKVPSADGGDWDVHIDHRKTRVIEAREVIGGLAEEFLSARFSPRADELVKKVVMDQARVPA